MSDSEQERPLLPLPGATPEAPLRTAGTLQVLALMFWAITTLTLVAGVYLWIRFGLTGTLPALLFLGAMAAMGAGAAVLLRRLAAKM